MCIISQRKFGPTLSLAVVLIVGCSQSSDDSEATIELVSFQQTLLREAVPNLSEYSSAKVELSEEVNQIDSLWIDVEMPGQQKLTDVLQAIVVFIEQEHHVRLQVVRKSPRDFLIQKAPDDHPQSVP